MGLSPIHTMANAHQAAHNVKHLLKISNVAPLKPFLPQPISFKVFSVTTVLPPPVLSLPLLVMSLYVLQEHLLNSPANATIASKTDIALVIVL